MRITCIKAYQCKGMQTEQLTKFKRNWVFGTHSYFLIPISLQPDYLNLKYFKLRLFNLTEFTVWNISGLQHWVAKIKVWENQSLWQRLLSKCLKWTAMCSSDLL